jgi:hypothetical protein
MPQLRLVTGPVSGLEEAFIRDVATAREADPLAKVTVLVGQSLLKRYLPRMLAKGGSAHINVHFRMPDELAAELGRPTIGPSTRMSRNAERLLVRLTAETAKGYFAQIARGDGFTRALLALFRELERGGLEADTFSTACETAGLTGSKFEELASLFHEYLRRRTASGLTGPANDYPAADAACLEGPLLIYGLWAPTQALLTLIERIASTHDVSVYLPSCADDADEAHAEFRSWLDARNASHEALTDNDGSIGEAVAARTAAHVDSPLATDRVSLLSAPDTVREVWEAARACMGWAAEGSAFHEMAVVYRNREPYRALAEEVFREAGIEVYLHDGSLLSMHPLGRRLLALL